MIPRKKRVRKRPLKSVAMAVKVLTIAQRAMAEDMYHEGRRRVRAMLDGICPKIYPTNRIDTQVWYWLPVRFRSP